MIGLSENSYRLTKKVALSMAFAESSNERVKLRDLIQEAFDATSLFLEQIDASILRDSFTHFAALFQLNGQAKLAERSVRDEWVKDQCNLMQELGFHQKLVQTVGNQFAGWDCELVTIQQLGDALDQLVHMSSDSPGVLETAMVEKLSAGDDQRIAQTYTHAVAGLSLLLTAMDRVEIDQESAKEWSLVATFGAQLVDSNVQLLKQACVDQG